MPTAAKFASALLMAVFAWWIASHLVITNLQEGRSAGHMVQITTLIGLVVGWRVTGQRIGDGMGRAAGVGMTAAAVMFFWALAIFSMNRMIERAMQNRYHGPMEAVLDVFRLGSDYVRELISPTTGIILLLGCVIIAMVAEWINRWAR